ncbi:MAG: HAMP domain-containing protein [Deltaproteobacteria bacterium]|nr:HAMP domain-containing protein [Deltaproteobacteria bacterium]
MSQQTSLRAALTRSMLLATGGALGVALAAMLALEAYVVTRDAERSLATVGEVISTFSQAAFEFDDADAAAEALATLANQPDAAYAVLVKPSGEVFASWGEIPEDVAALPEQASGASLLANQSVWKASISSGSRSLGTLVLSTSLNGAFAQIASMAAVMTAIALGAFAIAAVLSGRLRDEIARPLAELARSAEAMAGGDLRAEAKIAREDEIGGLASSFNRMGQSLRALVAQARESSHAIAGEAKRLSDAGNAMLDDARQHEGAAADTATSVEQLSTQVAELSRTTGVLAESAKQASDTTAATDRALTASASGVNQLFETVDETAASVLELTAAVRQIAGNASQLGDATKSTADAMLSLDQALREVESNARESRDATQQAADAARSGEAAVDQVVSGMGAVAHGFGEVERIVGDLAQRSKAIEQVLRVIEEVADQTNLLALNAAIIASQAGSHGQAFSVVAAEVKGLAKRTAASAREIGSSIGSVLKGIDAAVAATSSGAERVREGTRRSEEAGAALRVIRTSAERSSGAVDAIARAAEDQVRGIETFSAELMRVRTMVDEIGRATREQDNAGGDIQRGIETVRDLAEGLKRSTGDLSDQSRVSSRAVESVATALTQIRDGAESQRAAAGHILEATHVFRDGAAETTRRAESMRATVKALH